MENSDPSERLAPPITQLLDSRIYQPASGRPRTLSGLKGSAFSFLPGPLFLFFMVVVAFFIVVVARPSIEYR